MLWWYNNICLLCAYNSYLHTETLRVFKDHVLVHFCSPSQNEQKTDLKKF